MKNICRWYCLRFKNHAEAEKVASDINLLIEKGYFKIKEWSISQNHQKVSETSDVLVDSDLANTELSAKSQRVLDVKWGLKSYIFQFKVRLNFSPKEKETKNRAWNTTDKFNHAVIDTINQDNDTITSLETWCKLGTCFWRIYFADHQITMNSI